MDCKEEALSKFASSNDARFEPFPRSNARSADCIFAKIPTTRSVPEVMIPVSTKPKRFPDVAIAASSVVLDLSEGCNGAYAESGGKSSLGTPDVTEYAEDASRYGSGMSRLVNASGKENHDARAAGMLSSVGLYAELLDSAGFPRSDSPLGLLFIGDHECVCLWGAMRPFSGKANAFCVKAWE